MQARTPGSPSTFTRQLGQSPVRQNGARRRWYFSDRVKVRTPARYSALATVSPGSTSTRPPSNRSPSANGLDPVADRVPDGGHPSPAPERVEPPLFLWTGRVLAEVDASEVGLGIVRGERTQL